MYSARKEDRCELDISGSSALLLTSNMENGEMPGVLKLGELIGALHFPKQWKIILLLLKS